MNIQRILFFLLISLTSVSIANQKIDFSDENVAKDILLSKTWTCHLVDDHGTTDGIWTFSSVKGNKVKGKFEIYKRIQ